MRDAKDIELRRTGNDSSNEALSDITECLADLLSSSTSGEKSRGRRSAKKFMRTLAPEMSESNRIRALFASLEASTLSQTPELGVLSLSERTRVQAAFELARRYRFYLS